MIFFNEMQVVTRTAILETKHSNTMRPKDMTISYLCADQMNNAEKILSLFFFSCQITKVCMCGKITAVPKIVSDLN